MKLKNGKIALATAFFLAVCSLPVMAHDETSEQEKDKPVQEEKAKEPVATDSEQKVAAPDDKMGHDHDMKEHDEKSEHDEKMQNWHGHDHDHEREDTDFTRVFKEGTLNVIPPFTFNKDTLYLLYSHNYLVSTFPRGSNPAFHFSYVPVKNLQLDTIFSLRYSPLEWEIGAKYQILNEFEGSPISLAPRLSYNTRGNVVGLDVSATKIFFDDILQIGLGYRALGYIGDPKIDDLTSKFENGIGINTIVRVWKHWHLFGDIVLPFDGTLLANHGFIWSAGIKKRIPHTPHILTLYVGNSNESTITGRSISTGNGKYPDMLKVGFQFSIGIPNASKFPERLF